MNEEGIIKNEAEVHSELASFFDLLARFDFEDKQREKLALNPGSPVSAPGKPELGADH